jgi:hypothetical protein
MERTFVELFDCSIRPDRLTGSSPMVVEDWLCIRICTFFLVKCAATCAEMRFDGFLSLFDFNRTRYCHLLFFFTTRERAVGASSRRATVPPPVTCPVPLCPRALRSGKNQRRTDSKSNFENFELLLQLVCLCGGGLERDSADGRRKRRAATSRRHVFARRAYSSTYLRHPPRPLSHAFRAT